MTCSSESQKGGSVQFGMWKAIQDKHPNHIVAYTDADLSTHLGQLGLLMNGIIKEGYLAAIGSRREPESVVVKQGARNDRGKLFIYLWKRMINTIHYITDTQCGFKAFRADSLPTILEHSIEKRFAFDIELLVKIEKQRANSILKVPIAWIDSEAASTTTSLSPYLPMLKSLGKIYRHYLPANTTSDQFSDFIDSLTDVAWEKLLRQIPPAITERDPTSFSEFSEVSAADLLKLSGFNG